MFPSIKLELGQFLVFDILLHDGSHSKVYEAVGPFYTNSRGFYKNEYACKIIQKKLTIDKVPMEYLAKEEIKINKFLDHPNIARIAHHTEDSDNIYIFTELETTLLEYINQHGPFDEIFARSIFKEVLKTVLFMQSKGVCYCDIKADNILVCGLFRIKFIDFGCSVFVDSQHIVDGCRGTPNYMSPECIDEAKRDGFASDAWSCGILLYFMLVAEYPWKKATNKEELKELIHKAEYKIPSDVKLSDDMSNLLRNLLQVDPKKRLTVKDALKVIS